MTVNEAIRSASQRLSATSDTARLDAELLMAHALDVSRSEMLLRHMGGQPPASFGVLIDRRAANEPIAYIIGEQEFYGRRFLVGPGVLIPRGDSETLIEAAIEAQPDPARVLDCGTGSGVLLLTILAERPSATGVGIDCSADAVAIATDNTGTLGLSGRCAISQLSWRDEGWANNLGTFDLILCNPPYVETDAKLDPDVRDFEPASALFAGKEGLDDYRVLIPQIRKLMNANSVAIFEIGATQATPVTEIAEESGFSVELRCDLANRPRCVILR